MRKFGVLASTIFNSAILAGLYGIIHDQVTYSISAEYFARFKFEQFALEPAWFGGHRQTVAVIGFLASWWTGIIIGIVLGLTALIYKDHQTMRKAIRKSILLTFCVAVFTSFIGYFYGRAHSAKSDLSSWIPNDVVDKQSFYVVGSIHNFSYLGGLLGLIGGIIWLVRKNNSHHTTQIVLPRT